MRDQDDADRVQSRPPSHAGDDGSSVGYKRPPKHSQFKPGQSGNARGRPRGSKNLTVVLAEILEETVPVSLSGRATRMTLMEALLSSSLNRALKGDKAAFDFVLFIAERTGRLDDPSMPGRETGIAIFPERSASHEEWETKHGAAARGDKYFSNNGQPRRPAATSTVEAGDELFADGNLPDAFATYRRALSLRKRPLEKCETQEERDGLLEVVHRMLRVAQCLLLGGYYQEAFNIAVIAEAAVPQEPWAYSTRFYALVHLGRIDEARILLDQFKGQMWTNYEAEDGSHKLPWEAGLVEGFWLIRNAGRNHTLLDEIENSLEQKQSTTKSRKKRRRKRLDPGSAPSALLSKDDPSQPK